jgi:hypothetical protein
LYRKPQIIRIFNVLLSLFPELYTTPPTTLRDPISAHIELQPRALSLPRF